MGVTTCGFATVTPPAHAGLPAGNSITPPPFVCVLKHWSEKGEGNAVESLLATIVFRRVPLPLLTIPPPVYWAKLKTIVACVIEKGWELAAMTSPPPVASALPPSARLLLIVLLWMVTRPLEARETPPPVPPPPLEWAMLLANVDLTIVTLPPSPWTPPPKARVPR